MAIKDLIGTFSTRTDVPIELDEIVGEVKKFDVVDEIYYWHLDLDTGVLRGEIKFWTYPDGNGAKRVADIHYAKSLSVPWQRLVVCKELLHILDPASSRASTPDQVRDLVSRIRLPREDQEPVGDGGRALSDRLATYQALAILFPWETRQLLLEPFNSGALDMDHIADKIIGVPLRYTALVLSDAWPPAYDFLKRA